MHEPTRRWWQRWWPSRQRATRPAAPHFGRFEVVGLLGQGASGPVHLARDGQRTVALKTLALQPTLSEREQAELRERFLRQAQALRALSQPDIVAVIDSGVSDGVPWIAMEHVGGTELTRYTHVKRLLPEALVLRIAARIARALAHAHAQGIVHRDLKPANVLIDLGTDSLKVVDFGIARVADGAVTRTGVTLGTPAYMAPEQLAGESADARGDTYALGVLLYELLAGRLPYPAATLGDLLRAVAAGQAVPLHEVRPSVPADLSARVASMLHRNPSLRPQDLPALAQEFEHMAGAWPARAQT